MKPRSVLTGLFLLISPASPLITVLQSCRLCSLSAYFPFFRAPLLKRSLQLSTLSRKPSAYVSLFIVIPSSFVHLLFTTLSSALCNQHLVQHLIQNRYLTFFVKYVPYSAITDKVNTSLLHLKTKEVLWHNSQATSCLGATRWAAALSLPFRLGLSGAPPSASG